MKKVRGYITVEATLIASILVPFIIFFLYLYQIIMIQEELHFKGTCLCRELSSNGVIFNYFTREEMEQENTKEELNDLKVGIIDNGIVKATFFQLFPESTRINKYIKGGVRGLSFWGSCLINESEYVIVQLNYQIKFPVFPSVLPSKTVVQKIQMRSFTGYAVSSQLHNDSSITKEQTVYITKNASVYHTNKDCSYLNITCTPVAYHQISMMKNSQNGTYRACQYCYKTNEIPNGTVYITQSGNCFHKTLRCSAIKREIMAVPMSEVTNLRKCKRCQKASK